MMYLKSTVFTCILSVLVYYLYNYYTYNYKADSHLEDLDGTLQLFSKEHLTQYVNENELYLAILGHVFDVTKGKSYYKKGETYHCFVGKDGSRAFVSGNFTDEGLTEDIDDITAVEAAELNNWLDFYKSHYPFKGHLIGRFFDASGIATQFWHRFQVKLKEAQEDSDEVMKDKLKYPPCNIAWSQNEGTRVWCSTKSGGINREWSGVPRKLFKPGQETFRCACVNIDTEQISTDSINSRRGNLELYENCHPKATSCFVQPDEEE